MCLNGTRCRRFTPGPPPNDPPARIRAIQHAPGRQTQAAPDETPKTRPRRMRQRARGVYRPTRSRAHRWAWSKFRPFEIATFIAFMCARLWCCAWRASLVSARCVGVDSSRAALLAAWRCWPRGPVGRAGPAAVARGDRAQARRRGCCRRHPPRGAWRGHCCRRR